MISIYFRRLRMSRLTAIGAGILAFFALVAMMAPLLAPYDPWEFGARPLEPPSAAHWLGTNDIGQDIASELIYSGRTSLAIGFGSAALAVTIGALIGILAGFRRGVLDESLMGLTDLVLIIPAFFLAVLVMVYVEPTLWVSIILLGGMLWPGTARVVRSQVLSARKSRYVEAARALGAGDLTIMVRHILPPVIPIVLAKGVITVATAMLMDMSLCFFGLFDPNAKSWGMMIHYAFARGGFANGLWWWFIPPGAAVALVIFALFLVAQGIEGKVDPRLDRVWQR